MAIDDESKGKDVVSTNTELVLSIDIYCLAFFHLYSGLY
jgi:hypothetical protein